ncbi:hypothetical protein B0H63DRAFT_453279 [Podospora didyma]|uniref:Uncharacterized protein n=1 Tax=Podospora didyma TaxID=330526 RepID=A0AAE0N731_9PEZI|nr:hypothetical protein B0H63DRAFT_453279 [Podospora didyma]
MSSSSSPSGRPAVPHPWVIRVFLGFLLSNRHKMPIPGKSQEFLIPWQAFIALDMESELTFIYLCKRGLFGKLLDGLERSIDSVNVGDYKYFMLDLPRIKYLLVLAHMLYSGCFYFPGQAPPRPYPPPECACTVATVCERQQTKRCRHLAIIRFVRDRAFPPSPNWCAAWNTNCLLRLLIKPHSILVLRGMTVYNINLLTDDEKLRPVGLLPQLNMRTTTRTATCHSLRASSQSLGARILANAQDPNRPDEPWNPSPFVTERPQPPPVVGDHHPLGHPGDDDGDDGDDDVMYDDGPQPTKEAVKAQHHALRSVLCTWYKAFNKDKPTSAYRPALAKNPANDIPGGESIPFLVPYHAFDGLDLGEVDAEEIDRTYDVPEDAIFTSGTWYSNRGNEITVDGRPDTLEHEDLAPEIREANQRMEYPERREKRFNTCGCTLCIHARLHALAHRVQARRGEGDAYSYYLFSWSDCEERVAEREQEKAKRDAAVGLEPGWEDTAEGKAWIAADNEEKVGHRVKVMVVDGPVGMREKLERDWVNGIYLEDLHIIPG